MPARPSYVWELLSVATPWPAVRRQRFSAAVRDCDSRSFMRAVPRCTVSPIPSGNFGNGRQCRWSFQGRLVAVSMQHARPGIKYGHASLYKFADVTTHDDQVLQGGNRCDKQIRLAEGMATSLALNNHGFPSD